MTFEIASNVTGSALATANAQATPAIMARKSGRASARDGAKANVESMVFSSTSSARVLVERPAQGDITLLLLRPVATAGDGAVDHEIMAVDEGRLVAGEKYRGMRDILGQAGARNRLRRFVDAVHQFGRLLRGLGRQSQRLAENAGGDHARRDRVDADTDFA